MISPEYTRECTPALAYLKPKTYTLVTLVGRLGYNLYVDADGKPIRILNDNPWMDHTGEDVACYPFNFKALAKDKNTGDYYYTFPYWYSCLLEGALGSIANASTYDNKAITVLSKYIVQNLGVKYNTIGMEALGYGISAFKIGNLYAYIPTQYWSTNYVGASGHPAQQYPTLGTGLVYQTSNGNGYYPSEYNDIGGNHICALMEYKTTENVIHDLYQKTYNNLRYGYSSLDGISNADSTIYCYYTTLGKLINWGSYQSLYSDLMLIGPNTTKPTLPDIIPNTWYYMGGYYGTAIWPRPLYRARMTAKHSMTSAEVKLISGNWRTEVKIPGHTFPSGSMRCSVYGFGYEAYGWSLTVVDSETIIIDGAIDLNNSAHSITLPAINFVYTCEYSASASYGYYNNKYIPGYIGVMKKWH